MAVYRPLFKNQIKGEPLDLVKLQPWNGDTGSMAFKCAICSPHQRQFDTGYEFILEWGDTREYENTDHMCGKCAEQLIKLTRNAGTKSLEQVLDEVRLPRPTA